MVSVGTGSGEKKHPTLRHMTRLKQFGCHGDHIKSTAAINSASIETCSLFAVYAWSCLYNGYPDNIW